MQGEISECEIGTTKYGLTTQQDCVEPTTLPYTGRGNYCRECLLSVAAFDFLLRGERWSVVPRPLLALPRWYRSHWSHRLVSFLLFASSQDTVW